MGVSSRLLLASLKRKRKRKKERNLASASKVGKAMLQKGMFVVDQHYETTKAACKDSEF